MEKNHKNYCQCGACRVGGVKEMFKKTRENIRRTGFNVTGVLAGRGEPAFSYTSGLETTFKHPEIVVFGMDVRTGYDILHAAVDLIRDGTKFAPGEAYDKILVGLNVAFREIPGATASNRFYLAYSTQPGLGVRFTQLVLPDRAGLFPWEKNFDMSLDDMQPRLWQSH